MGTKRWNLAALAVAAATAALLAGCGGGSDDGNGNGNQVPSYTRLVSFGDSLSDVGSYRTAGMQQFYGGGQFTVNDYSASRPKAGTNWTEQLAYELALPAPCAARTGLTPPAGSPFAALGEATQDRAGCFNYAQGGARVTQLYGPGNPARLPDDTRGYLGALTEPLVSQVAHHLAVSGGRFSEGDLVTVLAGGNDALIVVEPLTAALARGESAAVIGNLFQQAVQAMGTAGDDLAQLVQRQLLGNGAQRVLLMLLPDVGVTPSVAQLTPQQRAGIAQLSQAFNAPLKQAFAAEPRVLLVDAFTASQRQAQTPQLYGLTNATDTACALLQAVPPLPQAVPNSLFCSKATVVAPDVSHYWFADTVHLTPYGYQLLARTATDAMTKANWLAPYGQRPCNSTTGFSCALAPLP